MTGWVYATSACICCGRIFSYNPHRVPSTSAVTGQREPVCQGCMNIINAKRVAGGLEPFAILFDAYDPLPENEL